MRRAGRVEARRFRGLYVSLRPTAYSTIQSPNTKIEIKLPVDRGSERERERERDRDEKKTANEMLGKEK